MSRVDFDSGRPELPSWRLRYRDRGASRFHTAARYGLSYWDAAVVEAARSLDCPTLLSEDLADGADYRGVRVVNPFAGRVAG